MEWLWFGVIVVLIALAIGAIAARRQASGGDRMRNRATGRGADGSQPWLYGTGSGGRNRTDDRDLDADRDGGDSGDGGPGDGGGFDGGGDGGGGGGSE